MEEKLGIFYKKIQKKITVLVAINEQKTGFQSVWRVTEAENFRLRRSKPLRINPPATVSDVCFVLTTRFLVDSIIGNYRDAFYYRDVQNS